MESGTLVPADLIVNLLKREMNTFMNFISTICSSKMPHRFPLFLIDGFPRSIDNLEHWQNIMGDEFKVEAMILLDGKSDVFIQRCLKRLGRPEDNLATLQKRSANFFETTYKVVEHFEKLGLLHRVTTDIEGECIEDVSIRVEQTLRGLNLLS